MLSLQDEQIAEQGTQSVHETLYARLLDLLKVVLEYDELPVAVLLPSLRRVLHSDFEKKIRISKRHTGVAWGGKTNQGHFIPIRNRKRERKSREGREYTGQRMNIYFCLPPRNTPCQYQGAQCRLWPKSPARKGYKSAE